MLQLWLPRLMFPSQCSCMVKQTLFLNKDDITSDRTPENKNKIQKPCSYDVGRQTNISVKIKWFNTSVLEVAKMVSSGSFEVSAYICKRK